MKPLLIYICALFLLSCSDTSGTETTNGPAVTLSHTESSIFGNAGRKATVSIAEENFIPYIDSGFDTTIHTDSKGNFHVSQIAEGRYAVTVSVADSTVLFPQVVIVALDSPAEQQIKELDTTITISGTVKMNGLPYTDGLIYLKGTSLYSLITDGGEYKLTDIPNDSGLSLVVRRHTLNSKDEVHIIPYNPNSDTWEDFNINL